MSEIEKLNMVRDYWKHAEAGLRDERDRMQTGFNYYVGNQWDFCGGRVGFGLVFLSWKGLEYGSIWEIFWGGGFGCAGCYGGRCCFWAGV